tara:strand:- start:789 stop:1553 length:765 start_codon:yes stop_codon:yes gene_type:complete
MTEYNGAMCITFAERIENHVGMEMVGDLSESGWSCEKLKEIQQELENSCIETKIINLNDLLPDVETEPACVLVIRNFVEHYCGLSDKNVYNKLKTLKWDKKALMRGRVVNKHARWNLCFADFSQEPAYELGKGRIYTFGEAGLEEIRECVNYLMDDKLLAEGNYYYNSDKTGINLHGDSERRKVFGVNFASEGCERYLAYQWFHRSKPVSEKTFIKLKAGDAYIMSEKATGNDWKKSSKYTLRHAAGTLKFLNK